MPHSLVPETLRVYLCDFGLFFTTRLARPDLLRLAKIFCIFANVRGNVQIGCGVQFELCIPQVSVAVGTGSQSLGAHVFALIYADP